MFCHAIWDKLFRALGSYQLISYLLIFDRAQATIIQVTISRVNTAAVTTNSITAKVNNGQEIAMVGVNMYTFLYVVSIFK